MSSTSRNPNYGANKVAGGRTLPASGTDSQLFFLDTGDANEGLYQRANGAWMKVGSGSGGGVSSGTYASLPAAGTEGTVYLPTDSPYLLRDTGEVWATWGPLYPMTPPPALAEFTWTNQGTSTAIQTGGSIVMTTQAEASANIRWLGKAAPATPYTVTLALRSVAGAYSDQPMMAGWRETSGGKFAVASVSAAPGDMLLQKWNSPTSYSSQYTVAFRSIGGGPLWLRLADTGVNRTVSVSTNGNVWMVAYSEARDTFAVMNEVGWGGYNTNGTHQSIVELLSWKQE